MVLIEEEEARADGCLYWRYVQAPPLPSDSVIEVRGCPLLSRSSIDRGAVGVGAGIRIGMTDMSRLKSYSSRSLKVDGSSS